jgi:ABC-type Fe2+-enterobactin transport system substrate-binding protein
MTYWDIGMRHIVDVDGQLLAIDAEVIDTTSLLEKANRPADRQLRLVRAGESFALEPRQLVRLSRDEVLFFESSSARRPDAVQLLAA